MDLGRATPAIRKGTGVKDGREQPCRCARGEAMPIAAGVARALSRGAEVASEIAAMFSFVRTPENFVDLVMEAQRKMAEDT